MNTTEATYVCTQRQCRMRPLIPSDGGLVCDSPNHEGNRLTLFAPATSTPVFECQVPAADEYNVANAAKIHDNALSWLFRTFKTTEFDLRTNIVRRLNLYSGCRVLITAAGAGNDIPFVVDALGDLGEVYAQDYSKEMLLWGERRVRDQHRSAGVSLFFSVGDATRLPFRNDFFDAALHFGGINLFSGKRLAIEEMDRVVRSGGRIVIGDEGVAPWLKGTDQASILVHYTSLYANDAPLELLPVTAREVNLSWELSNSFFVISFTVSRDPLPFDIDVPHAGRRGGSMRTRFFGQLEGVDPCLRAEVFAEAERQGVSRVELIERLLRAGLVGKR
jgi:SAM-dependent methyltransferase